MILNTPFAELLVLFGGIVLHIFVIPTLLDPNAAIPRIQSLAFTVSLSIIAVGYMMLGLLLPMLSVVLGSILWLLVFIYRPTNGRWLGLENSINYHNEKE